MAARASNPIVAILKKTICSLFVLKILLRGGKGNRDKTVRRTKSSARRAIHVPVQLFNVPGSTGRQRDNLAEKRAGMKKVATALLLGAATVGASAPALAYLQQASTPNTCMEDAGFRAFDFWVGDWSVSARQSGQYAGTNRITVIEDGCAPKEEWTNATGGTGQSLNYYNPLTGKWRQIWVSAGSGGYSIDYEGAIEGGSMKMEGTIYYYGQGTTAPFRGTWTPNPDGSVRQLFEQYSETEQTWQIWFDGLYVRK
jgi:hypothetical protein